MIRSQEIKEKVREYGVLTSNRDKYYFLLKIFPKKAGFYKPFVRLILSGRKIRKDFFCSLLAIR